MGLDSDERAILLEAIVLAILVAWLGGYFLLGPWSDWCQRRGIPRGHPLRRRGAWVVSGGLALGLLAATAVVFGMMRWGLRPPPSLLGEYEKNPFVARVLGRTSMQWGRWEEHDPSWHGRKRTAMARLRGEKGFGFLRVRWRKGTWLGDWRVEGAEFSPGWKVLGERVEGGWIALPPLP